MIDESQIYRWFDIFKENEKLTEVRLIDNSGKVYSGYFTNAKNLVDAIKPYSEVCNIYFTVNPIKEECYGREQRDKIVCKPKNTTTDTEILARDFVFIDLDSVRVTGVSASDEEIIYTKNKANDIYKFLVDNGFYKPIVVFSSSGVHLYLRCAMLPSEENNKIVKRFMAALGMLFSDEHVEVDQKVFNLGRISRLMGTYSRKGSDKDPNRPQRMCSFVSVPNEIKVNDISYFKKIADLFPEEEITPTWQNNYTSEKFDLDAFITNHNIQVTKIENISGGRKFVLDHCLFDANHRGKDAVIFQRDNGAISYVCLHNSCSGHTWRDVRLMFEPNAYDKKAYNEYQQRSRYFKPINKEDFKPLQETVEKGKKWLSMSDIKYIDINSIIAIPTGYTDLDKKIMGLLLGDVSIISGISGCGKTSWIDCLALNVIQKGYKVAIWSGELQGFRFQGWINQIAAGKNYVYKKEGYDSIYYAPQNISEKINEWDKDKLFLYNNEYGSRWSQLFCDIKEIVEKEEINLVIIDNLMSLNITDYEGDKYSQQTQFINELKEYAKNKNIHVILVCHPRKENGFLRKESISGTADLTNLCDNLFIIHRVGKDFETRANEFFSPDVVSKCMQYDSVVEVCKNRSMGVLDFLVGMYYEVESRRLKNSLSEHISYGWEEHPSEQELPYNYNTMPFDGQIIDDIPF